MSLLARYAAFAVVATLANLFTQRILLSQLEFSKGQNGAAFVVALVGGTLVGLILKYMLDKRWIFGDASSGLRAHSRKFTLYSVMGLATTAIFWGSETIFWVLWQTDLMREIGAILGLTIGYVVKYHLDKKYVFRNS